MFMKEAALLMCTVISIVSSGCVPIATGPPFTRLEGTENGKVVVYLYMSDYNSIALSMFAGDTLITRLISHSYYRYVTDPGEIRFSNGKSTVLGNWVAVKASPGTTYFLKLRIIDMPNPFRRTVRPNLIPVDEETALRELPGLRLVVPSDWQ